MRERVRVTRKRLGPAEDLINQVITRHLVISQWPSPWSLSGRENFYYYIFLINFSFIL
jgi:hypothetical protein